MGFLRVFLCSIVSSYFYSEISLLYLVFILVKYFPLNGVGQKLKTVRFCLQFQGKIAIPQQNNNNIRGMCSSVGAVFSKIYHRTDKDQLSHNRNRCTLPRVDFPTYSDSIFCGQFYRFKYLKELKMFFYIDITQSENQ